MWLPHPDRPTLAEAEYDDFICGTPTPTVHDIRTFFLTELFTVRFSLPLSDAEIPEYGEDLDVFRLRMADRELPF
jgi:hypothetical protein